MYKDNSLIPTGMKDTSTTPPSISLSGNNTGTLPAGTYYLKNFSVWLDFLIMLMSLRTIITGFGHR